MTTSATGIIIVILFLLSYENIPLKPMKLRERIAAVIRMIGTPLKDSGMRLWSTSLLRTPAMMIIANRKPMPAPNASTRDSR